MVKIYKKAQQEMVGFVLIVVLVVVGIMVFLVVSLRNPGEEQNSVETSAVLESLMKSTSDCAIVFEPQYSNFEELFMNCYDDKRCENLNEMACDYLNKTLASMIPDIMKSENLNGYEFSFISAGENKININEGNCAGGKISAQKKLANRDATIRLTFCN